MQAATTHSRSKAKAGVTIVERYDVVADTKKRINLRKAKAKYFHVKALSNGCYLPGAARVGAAGRPSPPAP